MQDKTEFEYDLKRIDQLNLVVIWALLSLMIAQAFMKSQPWGVRVTLECLPVGATATVVFFLRFNRFVKSLLFGLIPALAICVAMYISGFSLAGHYIIFCSTAVIALYFNSRLILVYGAILNAALIGLYLAAPGNLTGEPTGLPYFLSIFFMFNGQIFVLYFLTKWAKGILVKAVTNNGEIKTLLAGVQAASETKKKQTDYEKLHVDRLMANLQKVGRGELACDLFLLEPDEDTREAYAINQSINTSLGQSIASIQGMAQDVSMLADSAHQGHLACRAEASRYEGEYRKIIEGMNSALHAIQEPIFDVSAMMKEMVAGNLAIAIQKEYSGDYAELIGSVNGMAVTLRSIIGEITQVLTQMAGGNLNLHLSGEYGGEFGSIKHSLEEILTSFNAVLREISIASKQVEAGTNQVFEGAQALHRGADEQADAVERLQSSIAEVSGQTHQNAQSAMQASQYSAQARESARTGNDRMQEMLDSMRGISEASISISKIIKVIDGIAFQTNLLALNAAVEAARAGQYGKGFAVVADEVRSLAQRSAGAARETAELIDDTVRKIDAGMKIATQTASSLDEIVVSVDKATELVAGIAAASDEQARSVGQIGRGIEQVAQVLRSTSQTADRSTEASRQLAEQSDQLDKLVRRFRLG